MALGEGPHDAGGGGGEFTSSIRLGFKALARAHKETNAISSAYVPTISYIRKSPTGEILEEITFTADVQCDDREDAHKFCSELRNLLIQIFTTGVEKRP